MDKGQRVEHTTGKVGTVQHLNVLKKKYAVLWESGKVTFCKVTNLKAIKQQNQRPKKFSTNLQPARRRMTLAAPPPLKQQTAGSGSVNKEEAIAMCHKIFRDRGSDTMPRKEFLEELAAGIRPAASVDSDAAEAYIPHSRLHAHAHRQPESFASRTNKLVEKNDKLLVQFVKTSIVPSSIWLQHAQATKEALAPSLIAETACNEALELARSNVQSAGAIVMVRSRAELAVKRLKTQQWRCDSRVKLGKRNLARVRKEVAEQVGHNLVKDVLKYQREMDRIVAAEGSAAAELYKLAATISNTSHLKGGDVVQADHGGRLVRARVEGNPGPDEPVRVSLWTVAKLEGQPYEEGFDTRNKTVKEFQRMHLYGGPEKPQTQRITDETIELVCTHSDDPPALKAHCQDPKRPEYFACLYIDARTARDALMSLAREAQAQILDAGPGGKTLEGIVPALKGMERATIKTQEKYRGCFDRLTDLARMTFDCPTMAVALKVLRFLHSHLSWCIVRIKNRLMSSFDASPTGGYRDMLVNALHKPTGHITEVQITLSPLLQIKTGGGHAVYKLARLLELNEADTTDFDGAPDADAVTRIGCGMVRNIEMRGITLDPAIRTRLFSEAGLLSPFCAVVRFDMVAVTSPDNGGNLLVSVGLPPRMLRHLGANLKTLKLGECGLTGQIPQEIGECCPNLEILNINLNKDLTGPIPSNFGKLTRMKMLYLNGCGLTGPIPEEFSGLTFCQKLLLGGNQLTGPVPVWLGTSLPLLTHLSLDSNHLAGTIPKSLANLKRLKFFRIDGNDLEVPVGVVGDMHYKNPGAIAEFQSHLV